MELINTKSNESIEKFNGERYAIWKSRVRGLIDESIMDDNALKIVDCASCPDDIEPGDWKIWNKVARGIILRSLGNSTVHYATNDEKITAYEILKNMDENYLRTSTTSEMSIEMKLMNLKHDSSKSLNELYERFDELVSDLQNATGVPLRDANKCARLLKTLPASYDSVVTAIETLTHDGLTFSFVKKRLLDYETKLKDKESDTSAKVLFVRSKPMFNKHNEHYKNYKNKKAINKNINKNKLKCHHCGRPGHFKKDCYHYKRTIKNEQRPKHMANETVQTANANQGFAFMFGHQVFNNDNKKTFILDSGASDHIINNFEMFEQYVHLNPPVKILIAKNNTYITATKRGIVKLLTDTDQPVILEDVLYSKEVPSNLLSVRKMQKSGMAVEFNEKGISIKKNGHIGKAKFIELKNSEMFKDIEKIRNVQISDQLCEACIQGKQARRKYEHGKSKEHIKRPLFIVHTDVCGPITPTAIDEKKYFVIFVDEFTHYCVTYLINRKSQVFYMFKDYVSKSEAHFNSKVVNLYCDNGGEYLSTEMKNFCVQKGISYHLTVPHTPQLNGVSERMIRTITEKARALIHHAKLDKVFWGEAVLTATYLMNKSPSNALLKLKKTPYELWHNKKPELKYLKVFGATVYVHNKTRLDKFQEKSWKGILVGYVPNGYKVWCMESEKFEVARDVIIDETNFLTSRPAIKTDTIQLETDANDKSIEEIDNKSVKEIEGKSMTEIDENQLDKMVRENTISTPCNEDEQSLNCDNDHDKENDIDLRRSKRIKLLPPVSYDKYLLSAESLIHDVPSSFNEIRNRFDRSSWEQAVKDELNSHFENQTWDIVPKPQDKNVVDCKWVFTIKNDEFGNAARYKARLVAKGFTQQYMTDYDQTYAPVARIETFRFILAFANQYSLQVHHMDVKTAFLNGILREEIYMKIPEGLEYDESKVCKLNKAIYGLKQAARCWFEVFDQAIKEKGFVHSAVDPCLYTLNNGAVNKNIYVLLYVDDLVIVTACSQVLYEFKEYLKNKFQMKDLSEIKYFVGIRIERTDDKIILSQSAYIKSVLEKFKMNDCKPVSSPLDTKLNYEALNSEEEYDTPCRNVIGCLMYMMICTRPDLSICVNILSRYSSKMNKELWQNLKRVLRYLKGTIDLKLVYEASDYKEVLTGYVDSDWGGNDIYDRKSTTGYLFKMFEKCTISWNTRKQLSVATSSTEAEYLALYEAVREAVWLKQLAKSINLEIKDQIRIFEDNQGCISIANNPAFHKKTKHISIKYHYTREQIQNKIIILEYIPTDRQLADVLTKPLPAIKFVELRKQLGLELLP